MTDHDIPESARPAATGGGPTRPTDLAALRRALATVADPPPDRLDQAVRAALEAFDEAHGDHRTEPGAFPTPLPTPLPASRVRTTRHRRLAAVAAVALILAGLGGVLVARGPTQSTVTDQAAAPEEAARELGVTTTAPGLAPSDAAEGGQDRVATAAGSLASPDRSAEPSSIPPPVGTGAEAGLGSHADSASLLARVRADLAAPAPERAASTLGGDDSTNSASDTGGRSASGESCGRPGDETLGEARLGDALVLVMLDGAPPDPATRIRVYAATDCALLLDEPLAG